MTIRIKDEVIVTQCRTYGTIKNIKLVSKQLSLFPRSSKQTAIQSQSFMIQSILLCVFPVLHAHHFGNIAFTSHPNTPSAVIHFSIMASFNKMPHLICTIREVLVQPVMK